MLRHIVFFNLPDRENYQTVRDGLELLTGIPHARHLEIGLVESRDPISEQVDFVVYGEFDDEAALAAYKAHPIYQKSIDIVRPLRELRVAADYLTGEPEPNR